MGSANGYGGSVCVSCSTEKQKKCCEPKDKSYVDCLIEENEHLKRQVKELQADLTSAWLQCQSAKAESHRLAEDVQMAADSLAYFSRRFSEELSKRRSVESASLHMEKPPAPYMPQAAD